MLRPLGFLILCVASTVSVSADELSRQQRDLFEIHVRPTLTQHCIQCHGESKQEGGLRLTRLDDLVRGGDSGPAVVPGKPEESLLLEAMRYESLEMPPDEPLADDQVAGIAKWIRAGAPWPTDVTLSTKVQLTEADRDWWCYQPLVDATPPQLEHDTWSRTDLDRFIFKRLSDAGIEPSVEADPKMLARRVHFALSGLPPTPQTVDIAASQSFDYESFVDRLLQSEEYGRHQARYWLDLVRYAETDGYRADFDRPKAHLYRDYVIRSFNEDKPYDRFILEQIAGDEIDPGNRDALIATMYLRHWIYEHNQRDVETQWHEILSDITETTSDVFLAQGLKCARCHDHKFDPLLQKDFFRIKAFFAAFQPAEAHPLADLETLANYQSKLRQWEDATRSIRKRLREIEHPILLQHATREGFDKFIPKIKRMIQKWPEDRKPYEQQIASLAARQYDLPRDDIEKWLSEEQRQERDELRSQLQSYDSLKPDPLPTLEFVGSDVGPLAPATWIPDDASQTDIAPGFLTLLEPQPATIEAPDPALRSTGRRTALAKWIASPENPLTARVIVNRVWQQHFGRGLVETASDFGRLGTPPSHPELLDWLALRLIEDGWSLKKLHRRIVMSATYRQTSLRMPDESLRQLDPSNQWLWRMTPRRLSGEEVHDAIVSVSGEIAKTQRAIYKPVKRNKPDPLLEAFDGPDRIRSMGQRHQTTTAKQALLMGNGDWIHARAEKISRSLGDNDDDDPLAMIDRLYRSLFTRQPTDREKSLAIEFLHQYAQQTGSEPPSNVIAELFPQSDRQAVSMKPDAPLGLRLSDPPRLSGREPDQDELTIEAFVLLRSLYKDASVRTIVAQWTGNKSHPGWSLGVTSTKSAYKPRNLILQLVGQRGDEDSLHYEVIASNLRPELNRPYHIAVSIDLDDPTETGIQFFMRELTSDATMQTAFAKHSVTHGSFTESDVTIGGRHGSHVWDGLIDRVRMEPQQRDITKTPAIDSEHRRNFVVDWRFDDAERLGHDSSGNHHHAELDTSVPALSPPEARARVALIHALLNSNEFLYVD